MNQEQQPRRKNEMAIKVSKIITPIIEKFEIPLVAAFLIAILFKITSDINIDIAMVIIILVLSIFYFFKAFDELTEFYFGGMSNVIYKLSYISMSVSLLGILFFIQSFPGSSNMLIIGGATLLIAIIAILIMQMKMPELKTFSIKIKTRIIVILILIALIYIVPSAYFIDLGILKNHAPIHP